MMKGAKYFWENISRRKSSCSFGETGEGETLVTKIKADRKVQITEEDRPNEQDGRGGKCEKNVFYALLMSHSMDVMSKLFKSSNL